MIRVDEIYSNVFAPWFDRNLPEFQMIVVNKSLATPIVFFPKNTAVGTQDYVIFYDQYPVNLQQDHELLFDIWCSQLHTNSEEIFELEKQDQNFATLRKKHGRQCVLEKILPNISNFFQRYQHELCNSDLNLPIFNLPKHRGHIVVAEQGEQVDAVTNRFGWASHYYFYHGWHSLDHYRQLRYNFLFPRARHRVIDNNLSYYDCSSPWNSLFYAATESAMHGQKMLVTEKTFAAIAMEMPFVLTACAGTLEHLRSYGFQTFGSIIDESYDLETDDSKRLKKVHRLLNDIQVLSLQERTKLHHAMLPIVEHNYHHFYHGGFADILWKELTLMLDNIKLNV